MGTVRMGSLVFSAQPPGEFGSDPAHPPPQPIDRSIENRLELLQAVVLEKQHAQEDVHAGDDLEAEPVGEF